MSLLPLRIWTLNHIIAPHGVTDIVHAHVYQKYPTLLAFYGTSTTTGWLLHNSHNDVVLYSLFTVFTIVHFRHDFVYPKWILSSMVLMLMVQPSPLDALFFYMTFLHVPTHYRNAWSYIKLKQLLTLALLWGTSVWCDTFLLKCLWNQPFFIVSIMLGHIGYQEFGCNASIK